jgi:maltose alpha-D-glucosyltransferase/alpha-amylase
MIEMMNGLLFSLPGTPILYYGDEIGMGDNIYLGDRNAVRTPMQWDSDRNAGFSRANPQRLFLPVVIDPGFHAQAVNVEAQEQNPSSLLWWMRRLVALRKRYQAFATGSLEILRPDNRKVLAFLRRHEDELILVVVNLSRNVQCAELDLSEFRGATPVELFGNMEFPVVGDLPYFITLGPHGFYWFALERETERSHGPRGSFTVRGNWSELLTGAGVRRFEDYLPGYLAARRWFGDKSRQITSVSVVDSVPIPPAGGRREEPMAHFTIVRVELDYGSPELYSLPIAFAVGARAEEIERWKPEAIMADLRAGGEDGLIYDAVWEPEFSWAILQMLSRRRPLSGRRGRLSGVPTPRFRQVRERITVDSPPVPITAEQSNSSVAFGDQAIVKFLRRFEEGVNPGVELGRFLGERAQFANAPATAGSIEYRSEAPGSAPVTVAALEEFVPNEGSGYNYVVDALGHGLEEALANPGSEDLHLIAPPRLLDVGAIDLEPGNLLVGPHLEWASLLGARTAELHLALTSDPTDPDLAPEPMTGIERQALYHGARSLTKRVFRQLASIADPSECLQEVLAREAEVAKRLAVMSSMRIQAQRIRCHGDYHLGQLLWTGKDFVIIDFEGEPNRSLNQRRLKRPALVDVAGMIRSFHYASRAAAIRLSRDLNTSLHSDLEAWLTLWYRWVSGTFLDAYLQVARPGGFLPSDPDQLAGLLDFFLLEKAVYELGYEANSRPDWVDIPARGVLDILESSP